MWNVAQDLLDQSRRQARELLTEEQRRRWETLSPSRGKQSGLPLGNGVVVWAAIGTGERNVKNSTDSRDN